MPVRESAFIELSQLVPLPLPEILQRKHYAYSRYFRCRSAIRIVDYIKEYLSVRNFYICVLWWWDIVLPQNTFLFFAELYFFKNTDYPTYSTVIRLSFSEILSKVTLYLCCGKSSGIISHHSAATTPGRSRYS